ncbi:Hexokinase [Ancylostoma caninum]|uniref:Phosphotransferase n=1 Tax=Ancylostoma caninum TaxID=29170 RepID=A0A368G4I1_ANCCA|nr:Hexokinase [Ancylostoma caninum]
MEEGGKARGFPKTREILTGIGVRTITDEDCHHVAYVCTVVSTRAAYLTAAAVAQVLNRMKRPYKVTVGVDGSVYRFHPFFKRLLDEKIGNLVHKEVQVSNITARDASGDFTFSSWFPGKLRVNRAFLEISLVPV